MFAYKLGSWAAGAAVAIGLAYIATLIAGFAQVGFAAPIGDPVLALMEILTLLSAPAIVVAIAVVHHHAASERKIFGALALAFTVIFAGITSAVHFVQLTASRQLGAAGFAWPSEVYAAELLAWDGFLGLGLIFAAAVFPGGGAERRLRRALGLSGVLALAGIAGPAVGDMRLQRIGILGYAGLLPVAFFLLARFFRTTDRISPGV
ncbi:MAG: hypothetical protein KIT09_28420 [Bryobacteraceae bacterium]|nr:hypothetical protein [Bryobacteraceae bacterium]